MTRMALARFAQLVEAERIGTDTRVLTLEMKGDEPLGFVGGQYIIVDTGLTAASGKAIKRAYSLLSADQDQRGFTLSSKRLPAGPGSNYMHELPVGGEIKFSGPWGKLRPAEGLSGPTLVVATDTGVTAALGLLRGRPFAALLPQTHFLWLRSEPGYFLPDDFVQASLPPGLGRAEIGPLPPIGHPERISHVRSHVRSVLAEDLSGLGQAFIAGDGLVNYALLDDLVRAGVPATRDSVESFFNMPKKAEVV
jgi:NAD(P)H-flavin reductase